MDTAKVCKSKLQQHLQQSSGPQQQPLRSGAKSPDRLTLHQTNLSSPSTSLRQPSSPQEGDETYTLFTTVGGGKPLLLTVNVNKVDIQMELDTGAAVSVMSEITYVSFFRSIPLQPSSLLLKSYTGDPITVHGTFDVQVAHAGQDLSLPLVVVQGNGANLFGRNWLNVIKLDWGSIHSTLATPPVDTLISKHANLFCSQLGTLEGTNATIWVDPQFPPQFFKPCPVPYCLKMKVEQELECLLSLDIIKPVKFSDWSAPIVLVVKQDGTIRICGDYKVTDNRASKIKTYPLPRIDDLFAALSGGKVFTKLDLS